MEVWITGASGLVGSSLLETLSASARIRTLVRPGTPPNPRAQPIVWDPVSGALEPIDTPPPDAIIHLAGENIAARRWSRQQKERIRSSRVDATAALARFLLTRQLAPRVFICASAVGIYGNRGDELLTESSAPGDDFLSQTALAWEASARLLQPASNVISLRFGMILSPQGGALAKMRPIFQAGLGGRAGSGRQWISWIALPDVIRIIAHLLQPHNLSGPINCVSPQPVTNQSFTVALGQALHRPTLLPVPAFALKLAFGELASSLLLASQKVVPARLQQAGFVWQYPDLPSALTWALHQKSQKK